MQLNKWRIWNTSGIYYTCISISVIYFCAMINQFRELYYTCIVCPTKIWSCFCCQSFQLSILEFSECSLQIIVWNVLMSINACKQRNNDLSWLVLHIMYHLKPIRKAGNRDIKSIFNLLHVVINHVFLLIVKETQDAEKISFPACPLYKL